MVLNLVDWFQFPGLVLISFGSVHATLRLLCTVPMDLGSLLAVSGAFERGAIHGDYSCGVLKYSEEGRGLSSISITVLMSLFAWSLPQISNFIESLSHCQMTGWNGKWLMSRRHTTSYEAKIMVQYTHFVFRMTLHGYVLSNLIHNRDLHKCKAEKLCFVRIFREKTLFFRQLFMLSSYSNRFSYLLDKH